MDALRPPLLLARLFRLRRPGPFLSPSPSSSSTFRPFQGPNRYAHASRRLQQQQQQQEQEQEQEQQQHSRRPSEPRVGTTTPVPDDSVPTTSTSPFYFEAGYALFAKRPSRPFPPPFLSPPSGSFSDPLSTHNQSRDRRSFVNGEMIRGITNGDDAVLVSENFIGANDGVGAWAQRERGHAA